jgi:hypothetical protein
MKKLPLGRQTFATLRELDYLYVDKTKYIYDMIMDNDVNFLSRPRRFGKSMIVSTLEELYKGNKELFKGLYIYNKWDWTKKHPIIKLDFGELDVVDDKILQESLNNFLNKMAKYFNVEIIDNENLLSFRFSNLIEEIYNKTGEKLVVLIDEYDMAITENLNNPEKLEDIQTVLRSFYRVLKSKDEFIEFIFITGVSKFANTSIFSTLNSTTDITLDDKYSCICGYTHDELIKYFQEYIDDLGQKLGFTYDEVLDEINYWYDGYSWDGVNNVYAPYSCLKVFQSSSFKNFWFKTATPKYLVDVLKKYGDYSEILNPILVKDTRFDKNNPENIDIVSFFFETGYITIAEKKIINRITYYKLQFPNFEVESSLLDYLIELSFTLKEDENIKGKLMNYMESLDNENFQIEIKGLLTNISARIHIDHEFFYQAIFIAWFSGLGFKSEGETPTNKGQMDIKIHEDENTVIIAECKFSKMKPNKNEPIKSYEKMLKEGLNQIKDNKYYEKFLNKKIIMVALAFAGKEVFTDIEELKT